LKIQAMQSCYKNAKIKICRRCHSVHFGDLGKALISDSKVLNDQSFCWMLHWIRSFSEWDRPDVHFLQWDFVDFASIIDSPLPCFRMG
jgi:hypothetical protein